MDLIPSSQSPQLVPFVVGIAASAGGLTAILELMENASCHKSMCFTIVSHMPRFRQSDLSQILSRYSNLKTKEIVDQLVPEHCFIYVIAPNTQVQLEDGRFRVTPRPLKGPNVCANVFFKSLAEDRGRNAIGVVLSGARVGADGAEGVSAIKKVGGITFAQEPKTAEFPDMPQLAIATGNVDKVLSPREIGFELSQLSWAEMTSHENLHLT